MNPIAFASAKEGGEVRLTLNAASNMPIVCGFVLSRSEVGESVGQSVSWWRVYPRGKLRIVWLTIRMIERMKG